MAPAHTRLQVVDLKETREIHPEYDLSGKLIDMKVVPDSEQCSVVLAASDKPEVRVEVSVTATDMERIASLFNYNHVAVPHGLR